MEVHEMVSDREALIRVTTAIRDAKSSVAVSELAAALGLPMDQVRRVFRRLAARGLVLVAR